MHKLSKILVPIVAVLLIGIAGLSFFCFKQFQKYELRATKMANGLKGTGVALDAGSATGIGGKVSFSEKGPGAPESGSLSWPEFKKDADPSHAQFQGTVDAVKKLAGDVIAQRDASANAIAAMTLTLGLPEEDMPVDELQKIASYETRIQLAQDYAKAFLNRDNQFLQSLKKSAAIVGGVSLSVLDRYPQCQESEENGFTVSEVNYANALNQLEAKIRDTKTRADTFQKAIANVQAVLTHYRGWQFRPAELAGTRYLEALQVLAADLQAIDKQLAELERTKAELERKIRELKEREDELTELRGKLASKDQEIKDLQDKVKHLGGTVDESGDRKVLASLDEMDRTVTGIVLLQNAEWNFVVTSLGNKDVVPGAHVLISNGGAYLASGIVKTVEDDLSLVDLKGIKDVSIPVGATVSISEMDKLENKPASSDED